MIKIAVCDDENSICNEIERYVKEILLEKGVDYEMDAYNTGESLCQEMERSEYDLIFLDIELPGINGMQTGTYIREHMKNHKVQIAYVSAKESYALELFQNRPINFLKKPLDREKMEKVLRTYLEITQQDNLLFEYRKNRETLRIPLADIMYFTSEGRKVTITTVNGSDTYYDTMDSVYGYVKEEKFLFIHKSVIVSYQYTKVLGYDYVIMADGQEFSISQSKRKEIRQKHMQIRREEKK